MRLTGQEKLGYYPTPLSQVALIASWLKVDPGQSVRLLDPCCGEGEALEALAQALAGQGARVETWGVELSPARAEKAAARLDRVLPTAWEQAHVRDGTVSLCWLNAPYDFEGLGDSRRQEWTLLKSSTPTLMAGGVLVYIVPEYVLRRNRKMAAGKALYGDEVGGAIVPEPEDDLLDELARAALQGRKINLEAIFARENKGTTGPFGSSAAKSQALTVARRPSLAKVRPVDPTAYRQEALF